MAGLLVLLAAVATQVADAQERTGPRISMLPDADGMELDVATRKLDDVKRAGDPRCRKQRADAIGWSSAVSRVNRRRPNRPQPQNFKIMFWEGQ
jgi:hypothetical protein